MYIGTVTFIAKEYEWSSDNYLEKTCTDDNRNTGRVSFQVTNEDLTYPGIWVGEIVVADADEVPRYRFKCYVEVEHGLGASNQTWGPITVADVRMAIRDRCAEDNDLLEAVEFSNSEIARCMRWPVEYWNRCAASTDRIRASVPEQSCRV